MNFVKKAPICLCKVYLCKVILCLVESYLSYFIFENIYWFHDCAFETICGAKRQHVDPPVYCAFIFILDFLVFIVNISLIVGLCWGAVACFIYIDDTEKLKEIINGICRSCTNITPLSSSDDNNQILLTKN